MVLWHCQWPRVTPNHPNHSIFYILHRLLDNFGKFGGSCTHPLNRSWPNLPHWSRPPMYTQHAKFRLDQFILPLLSGKTPQILLHSQLRHLMVVPPSGIETKLNVDAQQQTFLYPTISKSLLSSNALSPIDLGMLIEDLEHVIAPLKRLGSDIWFSC